MFCESKDENNFNELIHSNLEFDNCAPQTFRFELVQWAVKNKICQSLLNDFFL